MAKGQQVEYPSESISVRVPTLSRPARTIPEPEYPVPERLCRRCGPEARYLRARGGRWVADDLCSFCDCDGCGGELDELMASCAPGGIGWVLTDDGRALCSACAVLAGELG